MKFLLELKSEIGTGWCIVFIWVEQQKNKWKREGSDVGSMNTMNSHFRTLPERLCGSSRGRHLRSCGNSSWNVASYHWNIVPCSAVSFISGRWHFLKTSMWMYCTSTALPLCCTILSVHLIALSYCLFDSICPSDIFPHLIPLWWDSGQLPSCTECCVGGVCARTCVGSCVTGSALALASVLHWQ